MGEKKAFKKFPKKQHIKNDTPSVQERVEEVYDDGRVLLKRNLIETAGIQHPLWSRKN